MTDYQLQEALRSIGKENFVRYYEQFADESSARDRIVELITIENGYRMPATIARVSNARRIFKAGRAQDALHIIAESTRLDDHIKNEARRLMR